MDKKTFTDTRHRIERYVSAHRLKDAFAMVTSLAAGLSNPKICDEIATAEQSYRYMLEYAIKGSDDPGRSEMARQLGSQILSFVDRLERDFLRPDTPSIYFNTLRYEAMQRNDSIPSLLADYRNKTADESLFNCVVSGAHSDKFRQTREQLEQLERRIFNRIWTVHPLSPAQTEEIGTALSDHSLPESFRIILVWALTLGALQYYDEGRLALLLDCYADSIKNDADSDDTHRLSAAAIVGTLLLMHRGRHRGFSNKILTRTDILLSSSNDFRNDLRSCYLEFAKTIDTDRITRKITDEIVPEMLKLKNRIDRKISSENTSSDTEEMDENPEWLDMLENSGIADKLKEMNEIQEEGGDVMMGTFSHLKTFPLFNEPYGWFLPFRADHTEFTGNDAALMQPLAELIDKASFLCDSDKYSFMLSLKHVPQSQRDMMIQQFRAHGDQLAELQAASLSGNVSRAQAINKTVQNAFRFFKLFRRKGEFFNPFAAGVNLVEIGPLKSTVTALDILPLVGEFYFSHGYYPQAIDAFNALTDDPAFTPDDQFYQKLGYAYQKVRDNKKALELYGRAEMLNSKSEWTLTKLAHMFLTDGQPQEALKRYFELEKRHPEKASVAINIGRCHLELGNYDDALRAYFKAEYLGGKPEKTLRPLAWTLMLSGDFGRAHKYYEKIISDLAPIAADYLNMGHLALAENHYREALNFYSLNISMRTENGGNKSTGTPQSHRDAIDGLIADIRDDMPVLTRLGVDPTLVPLLIDSLLYTL